LTVRAAAFRKKNAPPERGFFVAAVEPVSQFGGLYFSRKAFIFS
jgi:hypothetical protein